jgi:predicted aspartyl protease
MKKIFSLSILTLFSSLLFSQNVTGYFSGINKQELGYEYQVEVLIEKSGNLINGFINYSSLNCNGELIFIGRTYDNRYFFKEELKTVNTCVTGGSVVLEFLNDNVAAFYWYYADGKLGSATILDRSSFSQKDNSCKNPIQLYGDGTDVYEVFTKLNNVLTIAFILDSGASEVSITPDVALTLIRTGTIKQEDWLEGKIYRFADGSTAKSDRFMLRNIQIGNYTIPNVSVSISNSIEAPLLLGQNVLSRLGKISIDFRNNILCVE